MDADKLFLNVRYQVISDYNGILTVAIFINDQLSQITTMLKGKE